MWINVWCTGVDYQSTSLHWRYNMSPVGSVRYVNEIAKLVYMHKLQRGGYVPQCPIAGDASDVSNTRVEVRVVYMLLFVALKHVMLW